MSKEVRLIDANALLEHLTPVISDYDYNYHFSAVHETHIHEAPTIEIDFLNFFNCSICDYSVIHLEADTFFFCPRCGIKLVGGSENG